MLLFSLRFRCRKCLRIVISKHHMLLFSANEISYMIRNDKFQNIICCCLANHEITGNGIDNNFKTSYVAVQHMQMILNHHQHLISKHHMLLFSIHSKSLISCCIQYFKTSYVAVQQPLQCILHTLFVDFKTSYVAVQPLPMDQS